MKSKIYVRLIPVITQESEDGFKITIPGTNQSQDISKEDFEKRFGNCIDAETLLSTIKHVYNGTSSHCNELREKYPIADSLPANERNKVIAEWNMMPTVEEKLRRMKHQIDILENIKNEIKSGNTNQ